MDDEIIDSVQQSLPNNSNDKKDNFENIIDMEDNDKKVNIKDVSDKKDSIMEVSGEKKGDVQPNYTQLSPEDSCFVHPRNVNIAALHRSRTTKKKKKPRGATKKPVKTTSIDNAKAIESMMSKSYSKEKLKILRTEVPVFSGMQFDHMNPNNAD